MGGREGREEKRKGKRRGEERRGEERGEERKKRGKREEERGGERNGLQMSALIRGTVSFLPISLGIRKALSVIHQLCTPPGSSHTHTHTHTHTHWTLPVSLPTHTDP